MTAVLIDAFLALVAIPHLFTMKNDPKLQHYSVKGAKQHVQVLQTQKSEADIQSL